MREENEIWDQCQSGKGKNDARHPHCSAPVLAPPDEPNKRAAGQPGDGRSPKIKVAEDQHGDDCARGRGPGRGGALPPAVEGAPEESTKNEEEREGHVWLVAAQEGKEAVRWRGPYECAHSPLRRDQRPQTEDEDHSR